MSYDIKQSIIGHLEEIRDRVENVEGLLEEIEISDDRLSTILEYLEQIKKMVEKKMEGKKEKKEDKKRSKIISKIIKLNNTHPYLSRHGQLDSDEFDEFKTSTLEKLLNQTENSVKLLNDINLNIKVDKLMKIVDKIELGGLDEPEMKSVAKLLRENKINTLKDMINTPRSLWSKMSRIGGESGITMFDDIITMTADILYPTYMLDMNASENLAKIILSIKNPDNYWDILDNLTENKSNEEKQEIYNIIYHGIPVPEAPPAPFPIKSPYEKKEKKEKKESSEMSLEELEEEFESLKPIRLKRQKNYSGRMKWMK